MEEESTITFTQLKDFRAAKAPARREKGFCQPPGSNPARTVSSFKRAVQGRAEGEIPKEHAC
jgi:hypothetical protein